MWTGLSSDSSGPWVEPHNSISKDSPRCSPRTKVCSAGSADLHRMALRAPSEPRCLFTPFVTCPRDALASAPARLPDEHPLLWVLRAIELLQLLHPPCGRASPPAAGGGRLDDMPPEAGAAEEKEGGGRGHSERDGRGQRSQSNGEWVRGGRADPRRGGQGAWCDNVGKSRERAQGLQEGQGKVWQEGEARGGGCRREPAGESRQAGCGAESGGCGELQDGVREAECREEESKVTSRSWT